MKASPQDIAKSNPLVEDAVTIPVSKILIQAWVREACKACQYYGKSWSCPPAVPDIKQTEKAISRYRRAAFLKFRTSQDRRSLERAVLDTEARLRRAGFPRALGFFTSPCTACKACSYPSPCLKPESCRPTGESWGINLLETSKQAGLPVRLVKAGQDFRPVTLLLLE